MAMLAEPRRRKKYNLCPRGKALYEDDTRFGTKMLEKMGWSKGRGLGAKEDGAQEFVRVRFKNDAEGLGYENRDDQWTSHEEGFNGLLKELNGGSTPPEADSASEEETRPMGFGFKAATAADEGLKPKSLKENISGVSLEEKSKGSKARVHYKKFTRGKDLSQYSEKDLANIFGKKAADDTEATASMCAPAAPVVEAQEKEEKELNPNFAGVQTVSTGLSVNDYFRLKMEAMKSKLNTAKAAQVAQEETVEEATNNEQAQEDEQQTAPKKKKKKSKHADELETLEVEETPREKKKRSKHTEDAPPQEENATEKKKKKSKRGAASVEGVEQAMLPTEDSPPKAKKQKLVEKENENELESEETLRESKKRYSKENSKELETIIIEAEENKSKEEKKKKKSKHTEDNLQLEPTEEANENVQEEPTQKKKKKKSKRANEENPLELEQTEENPTEVEQSVEETKKSKKKHKNDKQEESKKESKETEIAPEETDTIVVRTVSDRSMKKKEKRINEKLKLEKNKKKKKVSANGSEEYLTLEQLIEKEQSYNICTISSFCAEKFHIFNMKAFKNSSLAQIPGYGIDEKHVQLNVVQTLNDASRIISLWESKTTKYKKERDASRPFKGLTHKKAVRTVKRRKAFSVI